VAETTYTYTPQDLIDLSDFLRSTKGTLESDLGTCNSQVDAQLAVWSGPDADQCRTYRGDWDTRTTEIIGCLEPAAKAIDRIYEEYTGQENRTINKFS
jgi:hypothetical protein